MSRLFGTDGVRGVANEDLTAELAFRLGRAAVAALAEPGERASIAVGRDTRASGEFLEAALAAGICSGGADAVLLGIVPTPAVAFLTADVGATAGAVISASHNPATDNGIKFFGSGGRKLADAHELHIEQVALSPGGATSAGTRVGRIVHDARSAARYVEHVVERAGGAGALDGLRVVVDCANGAASGIAAEVLRRLGATPLPIHDRPDGWNINDGCGATVPDVVARAVVEAGADAGVAHDGDADRALFADAQGRVVDGDQVLGAMALDLHERGELVGGTVVTTVMANLGLHRAMRAAGIRVLQTRVGDRYVLEAMLECGAELGGEQSGHVIFRRHATTGDGILTAALFLGLARRRGVPVAELASAVTRYPQVLVNVRIGALDGVEADRELARAVARVERELGDGGRVLLRASGTEPLVRVMVEAPTLEQARSHAEALAEVVSARLGAG